MIINKITILIVAFLAGSIPSAVIVSKFLKLPDPRTSGSKNPGATNILRLGGKKAAIITLIADFMKAFLPVFVLKYFKFSDLMLVSTALSAFLGHLYPFPSFRQGGKGVATFFGGIAAISSIAAVIFGLTWLVVAWLTRYSSLASLLAALTVVIFFLFYIPFPPFLLVLFVMYFFMVYKHHKNIKALIGGYEKKIGQRN